MSHSRVQSRPKRRIARFSGRRIFAIPVALGLAMAGGIPTATASQPDPAHKDYVCKYVGKPGVDERLQTGNNPIWVDTAATGPGWATDLFNDAQRSYVIVADTLKLDPEPGIDECSNGDGPKQPKTIVDTKTVTSTTCEAFTTTTTTTTTPYVLKDDEWVLGTPVVTIGEPVITTPTRKQLKDAGLDCRPKQPPAEVVITPEHATSCTEYSVRDVTVTTPYQWNAESAAWELGTAGAPVIGAWVNSTPTAQQLQEAGLDCRPKQPPAEVVITPEHATSCTEYSVRDVTVTTPYQWNAESAAWELGTAGAPVIGAWVNSTPTAQQLQEAGLDCKNDQPRRPDPLLTSSVMLDTTCTAFTTTTTSTTTEYVLRDGVWILGDPVETRGEPVVITPTAAQIAELPGLDCTVDVPPVNVPEVNVPEASVLGVSVTAEPKVTRPAKASVSVLGVSATANPLPAGASAGEADTSGQVAVGGFTGLAALLALGAAFMLRRRRGVA